MVGIIDIFRGDGTVRGFRRVWRCAAGGEFPCSIRAGPRLHFPEAWAAGSQTAFGAYVEVRRPGRPEPFDLLDEHAPEGSVRVTGTLTFFAGDAPLGEPAALAFAHEC